MELKSIQRDPEIVESGQWIKDIPEFGDLELKVRGLSSRQVIALRARKERSVQRSDRNADGQLKTDVAERIFSELLHEAILIDWRNLTDNGQSFPYSSESAKRLCTEPQYRPFADAVTWAAQVVDKGFQDVAEGLGKNSQSSSSGKSGGASKAE